MTRPLDTLRDIIDENRAAPTGDPCEVCREPVPADRWLSSPHATRTPTCSPACAREYIRQRHAERVLGKRLFP